MSRKFSAFCLSLAFFTQGALVQSQEPVKTQSPAPVIAGSPQANASKADIGYFLGFDFGRGLAGRINEQDIDSKELLAGFLDALAKKNPRLSDQQADGVIATLNALVQKRILELAKTNLDRAKKYLDENKKKDGVQTTSSGLQYKVISSGTGKQPTVASTVVVNYEGKTIDGKVFDTTSGKRPAEFGVAQVVRGFAEALQRMKVGDKWLVTIPPELGYGEQGGPGGAIGPNEALVFELELVDVK
jgi:FKBP-type peptidyl-prolyl cis-trans isomerase